LLVLKYLGVKDNIFSLTGVDSPVVGVRGELGNRIPSPNLKEKGIPDDEKRK